MHHPFLPDSSRFHSICRHKRWVSTLQKHKNKPKHKNCVLVFDKHLVFHRLEWNNLNLAAGVVLTYYTVYKQLLNKIKKH